MDSFTHKIEILPGDRILLIQLRAMGDMLLATPLIRAIKAHQPEISLDVLSEPLPAQVLRNNSYIDHIHYCPIRGTSIFKYIPVLTMLRKRGYKLAIDPLSTPGSAFITWLTGARYRIGYKLRWRTWAYTNPVERRTDPIYNPITKFDLVESLGIQMDNNNLDIYIDSDDDQMADGIWDRFKPHKGNLIVAFAPWSKRTWRRWNNQFWQVVVEELSRNHKTSFLLFASTQERSELKPIEEAKGCRIIWAGADKLSIVAALMKRCRIFIGADNGLKHIATAVGIPTVTIYTGSDPVVWNPPDDPQHVAVDLRSNGSDDEQIQKVVTAIKEMFNKRK